MFTGNFWLLFWGIVGSALAWAYYHYLGEYTSLMQTVILCIFVVQMSFENGRLRKQLDCMAENETPETQ